MEGYRINASVDKDYYKVECEGYLMLKHIDNIYDELKGLEKHDNVYFDLTNAEQVDCAFCQLILAYKKSRTFKTFKIEWHPQSEGKLITNAINFFK